MSNPSQTASDPTLSGTHWVSDPATGEYPVADAPTPRRRRARAVAAAVAAAAVAGFSGYAVGQATAGEPATSTTQIEQQQGPGGQPPTGDFPGQPPGPSTDQGGTDEGGTDEGTESGTDSTTGA